MFNVYLYLGTSCVVLSCPVVAVIGGVVGGATVVSGSQQVPAWGHWPLVNAGP